MSQRYNDIGTSENKSQLSRSEFEDEEKKSDSLSAVGGGVSLKSIDNREGFTNEAASGVNPSQSSGQYVKILDSLKSEDKTP